MLYSGGDSGHKPHESEHCGKCKKLGYNCRNYVAPPTVDADDDDDDAESVFSEASTTSSSSVDDLDLEDGLTPVASDEEEELEQRLDKALKF